MKAQRYGMSCLHLTQVYEWTGWKELEPRTEEQVTLREKRYSHLSWKSPEGLLLLGGAGSPTTTEFVPTNVQEEEEEEEEADDTKKKKKKNVYGFSLENKIQDACGMSVEDTFIITGEVRKLGHTLQILDPTVLCCQGVTTVRPPSPCTTSPATSGSCRS